TWWADVRPRYRRTLMIEKLLASWMLSMHQDLTRKEIDERIREHILELGQAAEHLVHAGDMDYDEAALVISRLDRLKRARDRAARMRFYEAGEFEYDAADAEQVREDDGKARTNGD